MMHRRGKSNLKQIELMPCYSSELSKCEPKDITVTVGVRLPKGLHEDVTNRAKLNRRSFNKELIESLSAVRPTVMVSGAPVVKDELLINNGWLHHVIMQAKESACKVVCVVAPSGYGKTEAAKGLNLPAVYFEPNYDAKQSLLPVKVFDDICVIDEVHLFGNITDFIKMQNNLVVLLLQDEEQLAPVLCFDLAIAKMPVWTSWLIEVRRQEPEEF